MTAPAIAKIVDMTAPPLVAIPAVADSHAPVNAPTIPTATSINRQNPLPLAIKPAIQPVVAPIAIQTITMWLTSSLHLSRD